MMKTIMNLSKIIKRQIARRIRKPNNGLLILYPFYPKDAGNKIIDAYIAWSVSFPFRESRPGNKLNREISLILLNRRK